MCRSDVFSRFASDPSYGTHRSSVRSSQSCRLATVQRARCGRCVGPSLTSRLHCRTVCIVGPSALTLSISDPRLHCQTISYLPSALLDRLHCRAGGGGRRRRRFHSARREVAGGCAAWPQDERRAVRAQAALRQDRDPRAAQGVPEVRRRARCAPCRLRPTTPATLSPLSAPPLVQASSRTARTRRYRASGPGPTRALRLRTM